MARTPSSRKGKYSYTMRSPERPEFAICMLMRERATYAKDLLRAVPPERGFDGAGGCAVRFKKFASPLFALNAGVAAAQDLF